MQGPGGPAGSTPLNLPSRSLLTLLGNHPAPGHLVTARGHRTRHCGRSLWWGPPEQGKRLRSIGGLYLLDVLFETLKIAPTSYCTFPSWQGHPCLRLNGSSLFWIHSSPAGPTPQISLHCINPNHHRGHCQFPHSCSWPWALRPHFSASSQPKLFETDRLLSENLLWLSTSLKTKSEHHASGLPSTTHSWPPAGLASVSSPPQSLCTGCFTASNALSSALKVSLFLHFRPWLRGLLFREASLDYLPEAALGFTAVFGACHEKP